MQIHDNLKNFSIYTSIARYYGEDQSAAQVFAEEIGLIPSRESTPPRCCRVSMKVEARPKAKLGWMWRCSKNRKECRKLINPVRGTFFEKCRIPIRDILLIIMSFVANINLTFVIKHLNALRKQCGQPGISTETVVDYYSFCREVAEVIMSHENIQLGGEGKSVQVDETFLTKRKYEKGRVTKQMTIVLLGLYCKEDKTGLFFKVNSKSKKDLWPYLSKYIHEDTDTIYTDSAKQYQGVDRIISEKTIHKTTNHSIGEFVEEGNPDNTTNHIENQNKLLKRSIKYRATTESINQYMVLFLYRQHYLKKCVDEGSKIHTFLKHLIKIYPGYINGILQEGLQLRAIDLPTVESEGIEGLLKYNPSQVEYEEDEQDEGNEENEQDEGNEGNKEDIIDPLTLYEEDEQDEGNEENEQDEGNEGNKEDIIDPLTLYEEDEQDEGNEENEQDEGNDGNKEDIIDPLTLYEEESGNEEDTVDPLTLYEEESGNEEDTVDPLTLYEEESGNEEDTIDPLTLYEEESENEEDIIDPLTVYEGESGDKEISLDNYSN